MSVKKIAVIAAGAMAGLTLGAGLIWFTAWDSDPGTWGPEIRFFAGIFGMISGVFGAMAGAGITRGVR